MREDAATDTRDARQHQLLRNGIAKVDAARLREHVVGPRSDEQECGFLAFNAKDASGMRIQTVRKQRH